MSHKHTHTSARKDTNFSGIYAKVSETNSELYGLHTILFGFDYTEISLINTFLSFTVQADANIKDITFIAQFAGDVDYLENRENDDCGCLMMQISDLVMTKHVFMIILISLTNQVRSRVHPEARPMLGCVVPRTGQCVSVWAFRCSRTMSLHLDGCWKEVLMIFMFTWGTQLHGLGSCHSSTGMETK